MDIEVGSNLYRDTDGMIEIEGVPQIQVALKPTTGDLLVTFALFDAGGKVTAKLIDSTLMINERRAYELTKTNKSVAMKEAESGKILLQFDVKASDVVSFLQGEFHTMKGRLFQVSPTEWKLDKQQKSGLTLDAKGGAVSIG